MSAEIIRRPVVAGQFYEGTKSRLDAQVGRFMRSDLPRRRAIGVVSPHAGLIYSGAVAGAVYSGIEPPKTFIIIGPNHTGLGAPLSVMSFGRWEIPGASFEIDHALARKLLEYVEPLEEDEQAHLLEHSLEVQLPFVAKVSSGARIVPIVISGTSLETCRCLGEGIARAVSEAGYPVLIVASSDMSHYLPDAEARRLDRLAMDQALALSPEGLHGVVRRMRISMCGFGPATAMLFAARLLGAASAELADYRTSGEVSGDFDRVVGYAGIVVR
jgi:AmmeMemoRadiSam system protein B